MRLGGTAAVVAALATHRLSSDVAQRGLWSLAHASFEADGREAIRAAGGVAEIVKALRAHGRRVDGVARWGFLALSRASIDDYGVEAILAAGGIPDAVAALAAHGRDIIIARLGAVTLCNICRVHMAQVIATAGAVRALVGALNVARRHRETSTFIVAVFADMVQMPSGFQRIEESGGAVAVVAALKVYVSNSDIANRACVALHFLLSGDSTDCRAAVAAAGGVHTIVAAIMTHSGDKEVVGAGSSALWSLSKLASTRSTVVTACINTGGFVSVLRAHGDIVVDECRSLLKLIESSGPASAAASA